jgi:hypothetical protein
MSSAQSKQFLWILLLIALLLTVIVANATSLAPMSFNALARQATAIARLRCLSVKSAWIDGEIWTDSRFAVLQQQKADAYGTDAYESVATSADAERGATITVRQLGGAVDGVRAQVDGVPVFHPGEEVYLFLWRKAGEPYRVLGWSQGTFRITRDARAGQARITQDSAAAEFRGETHQFESSGVRNVPLAAFEQRLHAAISANAVGNN